MKAAYLKLPLDKLEKLRDLLYKHYSYCRLCPRDCRVDRSKELGYCGASSLVKISYSPHFGEEDVLVGRGGSGTIFFAHCNLGCVYCQNYELSVQGRGRPVSDEELAKAMLRLQDLGCSNINLVTPSHYLPSIIGALVIARKKGLKLPLVYNTGGYESLEILQLLDGIIDIYMPDFKYLDEKRGALYSDAPDYGSITSQALIEMDCQVGGIKTQGGLAKRGLLIRHLVLPEGQEDTKRILDFISENLSSDVLVNLMAQYYPSYRAREFKELSRRIDYYKYSQLLAYARNLDLRLVQGG